MDAKWQEKLEKDEDEFANYAKGKYFADKDFFEAIAAGKYFEDETTSVNVKVNSECGMKSSADPVGLNKKAVRLETSKEATSKLPTVERSSQNSA